MYDNNYVPQAMYDNNYVPQAMYDNNYVPQAMYDNIPSHLKSHWNFFKKVRVDEFARS